MQRLKRVFNIDIETCEACGGRVKVIASIEDPSVIEHILKHLKQKEANTDTAKSHTWPRVSNDNPYSESQFRTQKYQPDYPGRFDDIEHARSCTEEYVAWYNAEHHHSGIADFTSEQVFTGTYRDIAQSKQNVLDAAYQKHPHRFAKGRPIVSMLPQSVAINPIKPSEKGKLVADNVNFPTLTAAGYVK